MIQYVQAVYVYVHGISARQELKVLLHALYATGQVQIKAVSLSKPLKECLTDFCFAAFAESEVGG